VALHAEVTRLQGEVAALRGTVERIVAELGLPPG